MKLGFWPATVEIEEVETEFFRRRRASREGYFLPGPIRIADVQVASKLGGSCLALLLAIHYRRAYTEKEAVTLPSSFLEEFGIDRSAKRRGLKELEEAKLVNVKRISGHTVVIDLRAPPVGQARRELRIGRRTITAPLR